MATNPAPAGRRKYCPVNEAPEPAVLPERAPTSYETAQLKTMRYRRGPYTPGEDSTYAVEQGAEPDTRPRVGNA